MRCLYLLAAGAALVTLVLSAPPDADAEEAGFRVETRFMSPLQRAPGAADAFRRMVAETQASDTVALSSEVPPGLGAVPSGARLLYGAIHLAGRRHLVALGAAAGGRGLMAVDLDGDGNLRGEAEVVWGDGRPGTLSGRRMRKWRFPPQQRSTLRVDVTFQQLDRTWNAVLIADEPVRLELSDAPPAGSQRVKLQGHARYTCITTAQGKLPVAFVRGEGERLTILTDANRNGTLGESGEIFAVPVGAREPDATFWQTGDLPLGGSTAAFAYQELAPRAQVSWIAKSTGARKGSVQIAGTEYALHILDADFDGTFRSQGDYWWFGPVARLQRFTRLMPVSMIEVNQPFYLDTPWRLVSLEPDGTAEVRRDPSAPPSDAYFHARTEKVNKERWFPLFEGDAEFAQRWKIDTARPRVSVPQRWRHGVSVQEGLRQAKAEQKPLLVDFEADWCNICKRWDYHVYADAEVARLLGQFVLLKLNVDFCIANDIERLGGKNPPYLVFLDADGRALLSFPEVDGRLQPTGRKLQGLAYFQRPSDFAQTLHAALRAHAQR